MPRGLGPGGFCCETVWERLGNQSYVGRLAVRADMRTRVKYARAAVDLCPGNGRTAKYFLGAHWINCPYWGMSREDRERYEQGCDRRHNVEYDGLVIRATRHIRAGEEFFLNYKRKDQIATTWAVLEQ